MMTVFSPDYIMIVKGIPNERRKFLNDAICQVKRDYYNYLCQYNRVLSQRNSLLRSYYNKISLRETLDVWDLQLSKLGTVITIIRNEYMNKLENITNYIYSEITNKSEKLDIKYITTVFPENEIINKYEDRNIDIYYENLRKTRENDIKLGYTSVGIHRDDIDIRIDGKETKIYGSQGQQRSASLTLKLAEARLLQKLSGKKPIIMLDDVMSELDSKRQEYILEHIKNNQVFITCCDITNTFNLKEGNIYNIKNGEILNY